MEQLPLTKLAVSLFRGFGMQVTRHIHVHDMPLQSNLVASRGSCDTQNLCISLLLVMILLACLGILIGGAGCL